MLFGKTNDFNAYPVVMTAWTALPWRPPVDPDQGRGIDSNFRDQGHVCANALTSWDRPFRQGCPEPAHHRQQGQPGRRLHLSPHLPGDRDLGRRHWAAITGDGSITSVMWFINVVWSVPTLLLVIAITFALGKGFWQVFVAVGLPCGWRWHGWCADRS